MVHRRPQQKAGEICGLKPRRTGFGPSAGDGKPDEARTAQSYGTTIAKGCGILVLSIDEEGRVVAFAAD